MRKLAPQEVRTFFVTSVTWGRRSLFQTDRMAGLFIKELYRRSGAKNGRSSPIVSLPIG